MEKLVRTEVKGFTIEESLTLDEVEKARDDGTLMQHVLTTDKLMPDIPELHISAKGEKLLANGNKLSADAFAENKIHRDTYVKVFDENGRFVALYEYSEVYSETQCAKMELEYLAQAMGWEKEKLENKILVQRLNEKKIPLEINPITVALTYKAAKTEEAKGHVAAARECYELFFHQVFQEGKEEENGKKIKD